MDSTEAMVTLIADVEIASLEREGAEEFAKLDMSAYTKYTFSSETSKARKTTRSTELCK